MLLSDFNPLGSHTWAEPPFDHHLYHLKEISKRKEKNGENEPV
jgi:hypothetical protein